MADTSVMCPGCEKTYLWSAEVAGRKFKCRTCQTIFRMPAAAGQSAKLVEKPPVAQPEPDIELDLQSPAQISPKADASGYELDLSDTQATTVGPDAAAASTPQTSAGPACPSCGQAVSASARVCVNCGYDLKNGKALTTSVTSKQPPAAAVKGNGKPRSLLGRMFGRG